MSYWGDGRYSPPLDPSPWAERFGETAWLDGTEKGHSGLNPAWPPINPLEIADWDQVDKLSSEELEESKPRTLADWDLLFRSERLQMMKLPGLKTWQLSAWLKTAGGYDGSGIGNSTGDGLRIDETEWPKVWGKQSWWETTELIKEYPGFKQEWIPHLKNDELWSVDNSRVWAAMRPVIELATRLLRSLCYSTRGRPFMDALLLSHCSNLLSRKLQMKPVRQCASGQQLWASVRDGFRGGIAMFLYGKEEMLATYGDEYGWTEAATCEWAQAMSKDGRKTFVESNVIKTIYKAHDLMTILRTDTTTYEKNVAAFHMATSLHHELIHIMRIHRILSLPSSKAEFDRPIVVRTREPKILRPHPHEGEVPFTVDEWGQYSTALIHGVEVHKITEAQLQTIPCGTSRPVERPYLGTNTASGFSYPAARGKGNAKYSSNMQVVALAFPAWQNNLLKDEFWSNAVTKYGSKALQPPRAWMQLSVQRRYESPVWSQQVAQSSVAGFPLSTENIAPWINELYRHQLDQFRLDMINRGTKFRSFRGLGYAEYRRDWQVTPYGNQSQRNAVKEFAHWYRRQDTDNCSIIASQLMQYQYESSRDKSSLFWWAGLDEEDQMIFYATLGYLMACLIPEPEQSSSIGHTRRHETAPMRPSQSVDMAKGALAAVKWTAGDFAHHRAIEVTEHFRLETGQHRLQHYPDASERWQLLHKAEDGLRRLKDLEPCFVPAALMNQLQRAIQDSRRRFVMRKSDHEWLSWTFGQEFVPYERPTARTGMRTTKPSSYSSCLPADGYRRGPRREQRRKDVRVGLTTVEDPDMDHPWGVDFEEHALEPEVWKHFVWFPKQNDNTTPPTLGSSGMSGLNSIWSMVGIANNSNSNTDNYNHNTNNGQPDVVEDEMCEQTGESGAGRMNRKSRDPALVLAGGAGPKPMPLAAEYYRSKGQQLDVQAVTGRFWRNEDELLESQAYTAAEKQRVMKAGLPMVSPEWAQNGVRGVIPPCSEPRRGLGSGPNPGADCMWYLTKAQPPDYCWRAWVWNKHNGGYEATNVLHPHPFVDGAVPPIGRGQGRGWAETMPILNHSPAPTPAPAPTPTPTPTPKKQATKTSTWANNFEEEPVGLESRLRRKGGAQPAGKADPSGGFADLERRVQPRGLGGDGEEGGEGGHHHASLINKTSNLEEMRWRGSRYRVGEPVQPRPVRGPPGILGGDLIRNGRPALATSLFNSQPVERIWNHREQRGGLQRDGEQHGNNAAHTSKHDHPDEPPQFWSTGEVGSHRSLGDMWLLVSLDDNSPLQVFDVTLAITQAHLDQDRAWPPPYVRMTGKGRVYDQHAAPFGINQIFLRRAVFKGYLLDTIALEDVAEHDGTCNSAFWVQIGRNVYDVSGCRSDHFTHEEWTTLQSHAGGNPTTVLRSLEMKLEEIKQKLTRYRVGILPLNRSSFPAQNGGRDLCWMTARDVAWHKYPEEGMYVAIDDDVYNLEDFADFHPGGIGVLRQLAGRDATQFFFREHGGEEAGREVLARWQHIKIGRLVEEVLKTNLGSHEVAIHELVLDLSEGNIKGRPDQDLLASIRQDFGGKDVTQLVCPISTYDTKDQTWVYTNGVEPDSRLVQLEERIPLLHLVVGKVSPDFNNAITVGDVESHGWKEGDGETETGGYESGRRVWCSVDGSVYDITGTVLNPTARPDHRELLAPFAGREIPNRNEYLHARNIIRDYYGLRCVGRRADMQHHWSLVDAQGLVHSSKRAEHSVQHTPRQPQTAEEKAFVEDRRVLRHAALMRVQAGSPRRVRSKKSKKTVDVRPKSEMRQLLPLPVVSPEAAMGQRLPKGPVTPRRTNARLNPGGLPTPQDTPLSLRRMGNRDVGKRREAVKRTKMAVVEESPGLGAQGARGGERGGEEVRISAEEGAGSQSPSKVGEKVVDATKGVNVAELGGEMRISPTTSYNPSSTDATDATMLPIKACPKPVGDTKPANKTNAPSTAGEGSNKVLQGLKNMFGSMSKTFSFRGGNGNSQSPRPTVPSSRKSSGAGRRKASGMGGRITAQKQLDAFKPPAQEMQHVRDGLWDTISGKQRQVSQSWAANDNMKGKQGDGRYQTQGIQVGNKKPYNLNHDEEDINDTTINNANGGSDDGSDMESLFGSPPPRQRQSRPATRHIQSIEITLPQTPPQQRPQPQPPRNLSALSPSSSRPAPPRTPQTPASMPPPRRLPTTPTSMRKGILKTPTPHRRAITPTSPAKGRSASASVATATRPRTRSASQRNSTAKAGDDGKDKDSIVRKGGRSVSEGIRPGMESSASKRQRPFFETDSGEGTPDEEDGHCEGSRGGHREGYGEGGVEGRLRSSKRVKFENLGEGGNGE